MDLITFSKYLCSLIENIAKYWFIAFIAILLLAIVNEKVEKIRTSNNKLLSCYVTGCLRIILIIIPLFLVLFYIIIFIGGLWLLFVLLYVTFSFLTSNGIVKTYLSLTTLLILVCYLPQILTKTFGLICHHLEVADEYSIYFYKFVKKLRLRLLVYFVAIIFAFLSSLQDLNVSFPIWNQIKPVSGSSVVTFLAFDGFISIFKEEKKSISQDYKTLSVLILNIIKWKWISNVLNKMRKNKNSEDNSKIETHTNSTTIHVYNFDEQSIAQDKIRDNLIEFDVYRKRKHQLKE